MDKFKPQRQDKSLVSIRIPTEILEMIDRQAQTYDISRNELINQMILFAVANMDSTDEQST